MSRVRRVAALAAALVVAGCGGADVGTNGEATLWITHDRGREVRLETSVPAGLTAMQALSRKADVETRYGGRFVHAVDGVEGSLTRQRDWFFFVNGIEADRSAVEYRLRPGDVLWWDLRSWTGTMQQPVVVGAFPEPFLHGYDGRRRKAVVRHARGLEAGARAIARVIRARSVAPVGVPAPARANVFRLVRGAPRFVALRRGDGSDAPVEFVFAGDAARLAKHPELVRFRYEGMP